MQADLMLNHIQNYQFDKLNVKNMYNYEQENF